MTDSDGKLPSMTSVVSAFRSKTSAGRIISSIIDTPTAYSNFSNIDVLLVSGTGTVTLPAADSYTAGRILSIKKADNSGGITITVSGGGNIDAQASVTLDTNYGEMTFVSNGSQWYRLGFISDGAIENTDISSSAAITYSKLTMSNAIETSDIKDGTLASVDISDGTIENADVSASAAITYTKLEMTNAILSGDIKDGTVASVDILDGTIVTGDISDGTIENADVSASAAITYTKLEMTNAILSGDIKDGTVASVDILDGTIENADVSASAAITYTKLAMTNAILSGDIKDGTVASVDILDGTIENADVSASATRTLS
ncbi:hypothetical protein MHK_003173, partial [Candidatus Magnetomorum sp. HK-1]